MQILKRFQAGFLVIGLVYSQVAFSNGESCQGSFDKNGAIDPAWVEFMMENGKARSEAAKRIRNTVQNDGIETLVSNRELLAKHNEFYTMEIPSPVITNQKASGRCWIFAGLNMLRSKLKGDGKIDQKFEFSPNYLYFFSLLEKSNTYFENVIKGKKKGDTKMKIRARLNPSLGDGGWWSYFVFLVKKYGIAPKSAMPETFSSERSATLQAELQKHLGAIAIEMFQSNERMSKKPISERKAHLRKIKERGLRGVWKILSTHLGDPPREFDVLEQVDANFKDTHSRVETNKTVRRTWTPGAYRDSFRFDPTEYVTVSANALREVNKTYTVENSSIGKPLPGKPAYHVRRLNLSNEDLQSLIEKSIRSGEPAWFAADIFKSYDLKTGILHPALEGFDALYDLRADERPKALSQEVKQWLRIGMPTHAMSFVGVDRPNPKEPIVKFKVENSWGQAGDKGYLHMYREWFEENVYEVIVHKSLLSEEQLKLWKRPSVKVTDEESYY